jgi:hypothetical protein
MADGETGARVRGAGSSVVLVTGTRQGNGSGGRAASDRAANDQALTNETEEKVERPKRAEE